MVPLTPEKAISLLISAHRLYAQRAARIAVLSCVGALERGIDPSSLVAAYAVSPDPIRRSIAMLLASGSTEAARDVLLSPPTDSPFWSDENVNITKKENDHADLSSRLG